MEFGIKNENLVRIIEVCENFSGTIEPGYRFINMYYKSGLKFFVTEGCAKLEITLSSTNVTPFSGTYLISIDYIKSLVQRGEREDEYIIFKGNNKNLIIKTQNEQLILKNCFSDDFPRMERKFEKIFKIKRKEFIDCLNFVSSINYDEVPVAIQRDNDNICFWSNGGNISLVSLFEYKFIRMDNFNFTFPYTTSRHLVKALEKVKTEDLFFGEGISEGGIKTGKILISFCTDNLYENKITYIENLNQSQKVVINKRIFSNCLKKAGNFIRRGYKALLISDERGIKIYLKLGETEFQTYISEKIFEEFVVVIQPHLLRSAISRLKTQNLFLNKTENFLYISNKKREKIIIIPIMKN